MILKQQAIKKLSTKLSLPYLGDEQDWDIEMANSQRINEFISFYKTNRLSNEEKIAVTALILASYDDFLNENNLVKDSKWDEIKKILEIESDFYSEIINYWSLNDESNDENIFKITPLMRTIRNF